MVTPRTKKIATAAGIGALMGLGLLHPFLWPLTIIGIALTLLFTERLLGTKSLFFAGWIIGTAKGMVSLVWFWSVYPLDWLGLSAGLLQLLLVFIYWIPAGLTLGLGIALALVALRFMVRVLPAISVVATAAIWTLGESVGAAIFSLTAWGAGSTQLIGFSFGQVGYALASHELLLGLARFGGVFVLTFVGVLVAVVLKSMPRRLALAAVVGVLVLGYVPITLPTTWTSGGYDIVFYSTAHKAVHPSDELGRTQRAKDDVAMVRAAASFSPDYIILPEDTRLSSNFLGSNDFFKAVGVSATYTPVIIDSLSVKKPNGKSLEALIHETARLKTHVFGKQYLVPQGEYTPYIYEAVLKGVSLVRPVTPFLAELNYRPGISQNEVPLPAVVPPVLFCFESVTPLGVKNIVGNRVHPPFVAHIVSHAWFKREPHVFWNQLDAMLRVQAVWAGLPIVQSANETEAKVYLPNGNIERPSPVAEGGNWKLYTTSL